MHAGTAVALFWASMRVAELPLDGRLAVLLGGSIVLLYAGLDMRVANEQSRTGGYSRSMHTTIAALLLLLVGPWVTTIATAVASAARDIHSRRGPRKLVGNLCTRAMPVFLAGLTWSAMMGSNVHGFELPGDYLALVLTLFTFAVAHEFGYLFDAFADTAKSVRARAKEEIHRLPSNLAACSIQAFVGGGIGALCLDNPWATPLVVPMAASAYLALERGSRVQEITERALDTFARIVDERDTYTFEHSDRVCEYSVKIGKELGLTDRELEALYWTSRLHDLGKVAIDNSILNKPGKLTTEEFGVMRQHPEKSARILASFSFDEYDTEVVRCHHERYDGRGYLGRHRDSVPREAFIIAVADAYDAMTSDRPYRDALPANIALQEIQHGIGVQFHPEPVLAFLRAMGHAPSPELVLRAEQILRAGDGDLVELTKAPRIDLGDDFREAA